MNELQGLDKDLGEQEGKRERAERLVQKSRQMAAAHSIPVDLANPHILQAQYDIEVNRQKTFLSCLFLLATDYPEMTPVLEEALRERGLELPDRQPSLMDARSSHSQQSAGSAFSRSSRR